METGRRAGPSQAIDALHSSFHTNHEARDSLNPANNAIDSTGNTVNSTGNTDDTPIYRSDPATVGKGLEFKATRRPAQPELQQKPNRKTQHSQRPTPEMIIERRRVEIGRRKGRRSECPLCR